MDKCKTGLGFNVVLPPYTRNFMPPKSDLVYHSLDDFVEVNESVSESIVEKPTVETNEPKNDRKENEALIIEDWETDPILHIMKKLMVDLLPLVETPKEGKLLEKNVVPQGGLTCLFAKATPDESNLWHMRLGHGKQHRASCKTKTVSSMSQPLQMLQMDLFCLTFVKSLMKKMYCLVVTNDFSRFSWVFFLATKDETSEILKSFIKALENIIDLKVKVIRCDNGTEFNNRVMNQFCEMKGINREFSVAKTPQQNRVAERKNRTLIKAVRTMLADSKLPTTFWADVANACRKLALSFMRPFRCPVIILNTIDHLGKFDGKADEGFFVGYSTNSKAFRVFNYRTRIVEENLHVQLSEKHTPNIAGSGPNWLFDIDALTNSMNYKLVVVGNQSNSNTGTKASNDVGKARMETVPGKDYILLPMWHANLLFSQDSNSSLDAGFKPSGEEEKRMLKIQGMKIVRFQVQRSQEFIKRKMTMLAALTMLILLVTLLILYHQEELYTHKEEMSFSDSEVHNDKPCTKSCLKNYETLKKQYDDLLAKLHQTKFKASTYKRGLDTVEAQLVTYRKNEVLLSEEVVVLKTEVGCKQYEINMLKTEFEKVKQEKEGIDFKIEKFENASKDLDKLLESQITDNSKKGLGYHAVPPPYPLIYNAPPKLDLSNSGLEEFQHPEFEGYGPKDSKNVSTGAPIIKDLESDSNDEKKPKFKVEKKTGRKHALSFMRPFGCLVTILNTIDHLGKFDGKADEGFFIGYSTNSKAFRVFNSRTRIVEENLHVQFSENRPNIVGSGLNWLFDIDALARSMNYKPVVAGNQSNGNAGTKACDDNSKDSPDVGFKPLGEEEKKDAEDPGNEDSEVPSIEEPRVYQEKDDNVSNTNNVNTASNTINTISPTVNAAGIKVNVVDPKSSIELPNDPNMPELEDIDELLQFKLQMVWTLVDLTNEKRVIGTKWVYRNKKDERGIVIKNKSRLVAQGYTQEEGIYYDEMDVNSAFLYGKIKEEVYVCQPPRFEDPDFPNRVYKVEKALHRLHQAPRAWYETLSTYLLDNGFQRGKIYKTLFIRRVKSDILLVQVYVDGIIFGSTKKSLCIEFEKMMHKKFQMSSIGELTFFLGLQVKQKEDGIFISQDKYVIEILKKFGFTDVKTASTPMETHKPLLKDADGEDVDEHLYRSMIGSLMYLTSSRPDIMFAVCACARFQVNPKSSHLYAVKRIFRYLKGQPKLGLWYPKDSPFDLVAYTDSDYARASLDRKSTTGGCQFLGCRLISWQCKKQTVVANSTTEAEYIAASNCCGQSTICIVKNPVFHSKTKDIKIRHHFIRDSSKKKLIQMIKIYTDQNVADLLTKAFDVSRFQYLIASLMMLNYTDGLLLLAVEVNAFWDTIKAKTVNGEVQLQALVDKKKVIITESTIRRDLQLEDANGVDCLPNAAIFEQLTLMGYEKLSQKLTFYKAFFSPQWKFLIHTILQCLSAKTTAWNEFSSTMASAIICLATNQKFNFSKYIFDNMVKNVDSMVKFWMYPRFVQREGKGFSGRVISLFQTMMVQAHEEIDENVPTTSNDPLLSGVDRLKLTELIDLCTNLQKKEDASKQGRKIADIDVDAEVTLINETQGRNDDSLMFDTGALDEQEVEVEKVVSTAEVTTKSATTTTLSEFTTTTTTPAASKPLHDKGKAKMIEFEKPLKKKDQIMYDQEVALNLQAQLQAKLEEEERLSR
ncbi:putative ribonuclease H-like domain-containing protein [Tanacetum coccineum]